jgi:hypothetical protein
MIPSTIRDHSLEGLPRGTAATIAACPVVSLSDSRCISALRSRLWKYDLFT